mmetsp:Transcript_13680/g.33669  ORF Transcript_13680/g.33669 Transcript_13680/m.33669 type:complete len:743 (-) Transcript_13680:965-3193(-)
MALHDDGINDDILADLHAQQAVQPVDHWRAHQPGGNDGHDLVDGGPHACPGDEVGTTQCIAPGLLAAKQYPLEQQHQQHPGDASANHNARHNQRHPARVVQIGQDGEGGDEAADGEQRQHGVRHAQPQELQDLVHQAGQAGGRGAGRALHLHGAHVALRLLLQQRQALPVLCASTERGRLCDDGGGALGLGHLAAQLDDVHLIRHLGEDALRVGLGGQRAGGRSAGSGRGSHGDSRSGADCTSTGTCTSQGLGSGGSRWVVGNNPASDGLDGALIEQHCAGQLGQLECGTCARVDGAGQKGGAAKSKEVSIHADGWRPGRQLDLLRPDLLQRLLDGVARRNVAAAGLRHSGLRGGLADRCGHLELLHVNLAVGQARELVQRHHHAGHHGGRQLGLAVRDDVAHVHRGGRHERHHLLQVVALLVDVHRAHGLVHARRHLDDVLHLLQLDAHTVDLDLAVNTAQELNLAVLGPLDQVARAVGALVVCRVLLSHHLARDELLQERVRHKLGHSQIRAADVARRNAWAGQDQLAGQADGQQLHVGVHHVRAKVVLGVADGDLRAVGLAGAEPRGHNGRLGGTVHIVHVHPGHGALDLLDRLGQQRLATQRDAAQRLAGLGPGVAHKQHHDGRHVDVERGARLSDQLSQVLRVCGSIRLGQHHASTHAQRSEQLHRVRVEVDGDGEDGAVLGGHLVQLDVVGHVVAQVLVAQHHALGPARGARGEQDVGQIVRAGNAAKVGCWAAHC